VKTRLFIAFAVVVALAGACSSSSGSKRAPGTSAATPKPEPIKVVDLPLPPTAPTDAAGSCTNASGCISASDKGITEGPGYMWDGKHVLLAIDFAGAPAGSAYTGTQVIAVKADGTTFSNGDPWKCVTCGVPEANRAGASLGVDHPQAFHDGKRVLAGTNIIDCSPHRVTDEACTPEATHVYPIWWQITADGTGKSGSMRELRLHPDDEHLGWSHIILSPQLAEPAFIGRLVFNATPKNGTPLVPRYELEKVTALQSTDPTLSGTFISIDPNDSKKLRYDEPAGVIGEFRGWSSDGESALGIGLLESDNFDVFSTSLATGRSRRLSSDPAYVDPIKPSPDDQWNVIMDSRVDDRMKFIAGLPGVPPLTDQVEGVAYAVSSMRNNRNRRFFQPYLLDARGDRGDYHGQQLNACGPKDDPKPGSGSICDPLWNGRADPAWSPDGTKVVYWQALVTAPSCGGTNPLPCPNSTEPGGRRTRLMMAKLTTRTTQSPKRIATISDSVPWGIPYHPGDPFPPRRHLPAGSYTLAGTRSGSAAVTITENDAKNAVASVSVTYKNYSNDGENILNGTERAELVGTDVTWHEKLTLTGRHKGTKRTSEPQGFTVSVALSALADPVFDARGTLTTSLDGRTYTQPTNGT
jgi:hypothetical protein